MKLTTIEHWFRCKYFVTIMSFWFPVSLQSTPLLPSISTTTTTLLHNYIYSPSFTFREKYNNHLARENHDLFIGRPVRSDTVDPARDSTIKEQGCICRLDRHSIGKLQTVRNPSVIQMSRRSIKHLNISRMQWPTPSLLSWWVVCPTLSRRQSDVSGLFDLSIYGSRPTLSIMCQESLGWWATREKRVELFMLFFVLISSFSTRFLCLLVSSSGARHALPQQINQIKQQQSRPQ